MVLVLVIASALLVPVGLLGVPLWVMTARLTLRLAAWERARFDLLLAQPIASVSSPPWAGSIVRDATALARNSDVWRPVAHFALLGPQAVVSIIGLVVAWSVPPVLIALPLYYAAYPTGQAQIGPWVIDTIQEAGVVAGIALVFLLTASPLVVRSIAVLDAALARRLLGPSATGALSQRVDQLVISRQKVVDSVEAERLRIERDLHDGAQQRLVSLAMTLGRADAALADSGFADDADHRVRDLLAEGRSNAGIAAALVVGEGAVEKHISNIFAKLGLPPTAGEHRRVLAVLHYLEARP